MPFSQCSLVPQVLLAQRSTGPHDVQLPHLSVALHSDPSGQFIEYVAQSGSGMHFTQPPQIPFSAQICPFGQGCVAMYTSQTHLPSLQTCGYSHCTFEHLSIATHLPSTSS